VPTSREAGHRLAIVLGTLLVLFASTPVASGQDEVANQSRALSLISRQSPRLADSIFLPRFARLGPLCGRCNEYEIRVSSRIAVQGAAIRANALRLGYNLDYTDALASYRHAIAIDPNDADAHRLAAATIWMQLLFEQGAITVEDYLGQARTKVDRRTPNPALAGAFRQYLDRATTLAEQRLRECPDDPDAHFQLGATAGLRASYISTVEGRILDSVGAARRAYNAHRRSLALDPTRKDAGLIVGLYQYGVASLSFPFRLMARFAGFAGDRGNGLRLVESAADFPSHTRTNARFVLALLYNREGRHGDALHVLQQLREEFPRNRLLWLEVGSTALRAGRASEAADALNEGIARFEADSRPRAYGEEARWRYQRGAAFVALRDVDAAARDLFVALAADAPRWIRGRTHLELGKVADLTGDRSAARARYLMAAADCRAGHDTTCADAAARLTTSRYQ
jgi:tetratricopeptide (TPR) repeat protein